MVFLGTPAFAADCLGALLADDHYEIVGVLTQPDRPAGRKLQLKASPVKELALAHNLPVLQPEVPHEPTVVNTVASWKAEVAVVVAYGQILKRPFLELFPLRIVNLHASLLPKYRGAAPIQRAIVAGEKETGISLQMVAPKMDAGDILGVRKISLDPDWNSFEVLEALTPLGQDLLRIDLMDYLRGNLTPVPQDHSLATLAPKLQGGEAEIIWSQGARQIHNCVRGLLMGPGSYTLRQGAQVKILQTRVVSDSDLKENSGKSVGEKLRAGEILPLTVVEGDRPRLWIQCQPGVLEVLKLQPASKPAMAVADFLRGYRVQAGEIWGSALAN